MEELKNTKILILDFDGVISDSKKQMVTALKELVIRMNYKFNTKVLSDQEIEDMVCSSMRELPQLLGLKLWQKIYLYSLMYNNYKKLYEIVKPIKDVLDIIPQLENNFTLMICSNNHSFIIKPWLKKHNLHNYFTKVYTYSRSKNKGQIINRIIEKTQLKSEELLFVSDTLHDYTEIRRICDIPIKLINTGFDSKAKLQQAKQKKPILESLRELIN